MISPTTVQVTYGRDKTRANCFVLPDRRGGCWYAIEDSCNVNFTHEEITTGCDVEEIADSDMFTWPDGVHSEEELERAVEA